MVRGEQFDRADIRQERQEHHAAEAQGQDLPVQAQVGPYGMRLLSTPGRSVHQAILP